MRTPGIGFDGVSYYPVGVLERPPLLRPKGATGGAGMRQFTAHVCHQDGKYTAHCLELAVYGRWCDSVDDAIDSLKETMLGLDLRMTAQQAIVRVFDFEPKKIDTTLKKDP